MRTLQKWLQDHPSIRIQATYQGGKYWVWMLRGIPYLKTTASGETMKEALENAIHGFEKGVKAHEIITRPR